VKFGSVSFLKNLPWDDDMRLFSLKIVWDEARAFLTEAVSTVLPPDLVYSSSDGNLNVSGPFRHCGIFSSLTALMIPFV
jgi:hypothetical protein